MASTDGTHLVKNASGSYTPVACSRWDEMTESIQFHVNLAAAANSATDFRMLNALAPKRVGVKEVDPDNTHKRALLKAFDDSPSGMTPLCLKVGQVVAEIQANQGWLRENGLQVAVIIVCDGQASDGNLAEAMKPLAYVFCYTVVLPSFLVCNVSVSLSLTHLLLSACIL
jgi:hypothetical protein